jgi:Cu2+-containing amine oxidase
VRDRADAITLRIGTFFSRIIWRWDTAARLEISDSTLRNGRGRATSYELIPLRTGTGRQTEAFIRGDFWVTGYDPAQILAKDLPTYIQDGQSTVNQDLVIWYTGSAHHETNPRDEDRDTVPVIWTGFDLIPQNLFDGTPFYP